MLADGTIDTPCDAAEPPEVGDDDECDDAKGDAFCAVGEEAGTENEVVQEMSRHQHREVEGRELEEHV